MDQDLPSGPSLPWARLSRGMREASLALVLASWGLTHANGGPQAAPASWLQLLVAAALLPTLSAGCRAPRGRRAAVLGLALLIVWLGAALFAGGSGLLGFSAQATWSAALGRDALLAGLAAGNATGLLRAALPDRCASSRGSLAAIGSLWLLLLAADGGFWLLPEGWVPGLALLALGAATVATWVFVGLAGRERGVRLTRGHLFGAVRFPCPRCGVEQDFARPLSPCNSCGHFVRVDWGGASPSESADDRGLGMRTAVVFGCPMCAARGLWTQGESTCERCGLDVRLVWNAGGAHAPAGPP